MTWQQIRGSMEISFLREVSQAYKKIVGEHDKALAELEARWKQVSEDDVDQFGRSGKEVLGDELGDQSYMNSEIQQVLARSLVMAICMTAESELGKLCKHLQTEYGEKIALDDFRNNGRGMSARVGYIEAVAQRKFLDGNNDFPLLTELRNVIAHDNGVVSEKKGERLYSLCAKSSLKLDIKENQIYIEMSALPDYITLADTIMREVSAFWTYKDSPLA